MNNSRAILSPNLSLKCNLFSKKNLSSVNFFYIYGDYFSSLPPPSSFSNLELTYFFNHFSSSIISIHLFRNNIFLSSLMASIRKMFMLVIFLYSSNLGNSSTYNAFEDSMKLAISVVQNTKNTMSNFIVKDFQHFNVLSDCSELFDSTHELLDWSLTKFQDPNGTYTCIHVFQLILFLIFRLSIMVIRKLFILHYLVIFLEGFIIIYASIYFILLLFL